MLSDISGSDKLIVVQDPFSGLKFIYRVDHESSNLDAAALTEQDGSAFNGKQSVEINAMTYKLGTADNAMKLLRGKTHWIQDKGSVLSVLLQNAASRKTRFAPQRIERDRMRRYRRACRSSGCPGEEAPALSTVSVDKAGGAPAGGPAQPARRTGHFEQSGTIPFMARRLDFRRVAPVALMIFSACVKTGARRERGPAAIAACKTSQ